MTLCAGDEHVTGDGSDFGLDSSPKRSASHMIWNSRDSMRKIPMVVFVSVLVLVGCASSDPDTPKTEVDGPIVSEGEYDPDREFSDEEVATFAATYLDVTSVQQDYQRRIQEAEDEQERRRLSDESNQKAEELMAEHGITPDEYNAIVLRLPDDDELRGRVQQAVRQIEEERIEETEQQMETP